MGYSKNKLSNSKSIYQRVTDYVIEQLKNGSVPWKKGWTCYGPPQNLNSGYIYHGWNTFFLNNVTACEQYKTPFFLTYNQALDMGGNVRKGEKGYFVIYWKNITTEYRALRGGVDGTEENDYPKSRLILKVYTVFNIDQTEGIDFTLPTVQPKTAHQKIEACDLLIKQMPKCPPIRHGGDYARYLPGMDFIQMPHLEQFHKPEYYYQTLFHELVHSTGHPFRLNRSDLEFFVRGDDRYAKEELVAELGSGYLCAYTGIEQHIIENSSAYIDSWLQRLNNDKTLIIKAASQAQAATNYILNKGCKEKSEIKDKKNVAV